MNPEIRQPVSRTTLTQLRGASPSARFLHRLHSVVLVLRGYSASEAGRIYGDSPRAVAYWVKRFQEKGVAGLLEEVRPGRPPRLNASATKKLQAFIRQSRASSQPVNGEVISAYLSKAHKISLTPRQCWRILKRLET